MCSPSWNPLPRADLYKEGMVCAEGQGSNEFDILLEKKEDSRATKREVGEFGVVVSR